MSVPEGLQQGGRGAFCGSGLWVAHPDAGPIPPAAFPTHGNERAPVCWPGQIPARSQNLLLCRPASQTLRTFIF